MKSIYASLFGFLLTSSMAWGGGTTAGGGNVQEPDQVDAKTLEWEVAMVKPVVYSWYSKNYFDYQDYKANGMCAKQAKDQCAVWAKLFDSTPSLLTILDGLEVETNMNAPCMDFNNQPNDGSMYGRMPGSICISISNIKTKLRRDNYENQIAALIVHEVSHLKGSTEDEANKLQMQALNTLGSTPTMTAWVNATVLAENINELANTAYIWSVEFQGPYKNQCQSGQVFLDQQRRDGQALETMDFVYLPPSTVQLFWSAMGKARAARAYGCGQDENASASDRQMGADEYEFAFKGRAEITLANFDDSPFSHADLTTKLKHIQTPDDYRSELNDVHSFLATVASLATKFANDKFTIYGGDIRN